MSNQAGLSAYQQVQSRVTAEIASPEQLVKLLFDALMKNLYQARGFIERKQPEDKARVLGKALDIIVVLDGSIDMEAGGEMAKNLSGLYHYSMQVLIQANSDNSVEKLNEVVALMSEIKSAWDTITSNNNHSDKALVEVIGPEQASDSDEE
ncbi:flagellar export chaperone FliS [Endozoicomonas sp. Mp262]|uniref:flagellar export chaperone FliS n=1 Tax=Endozoicomonas sp. Mp262 TaxID=2919499 RepID=UPI0021D9A169